MDLKVLSKVIPNQFGRQALVLQKNSPALMFSAGVFGVVATVILASRATLKLEPVVEKTQHDLALTDTVFKSNPQEYSSEDKQRDKALIYVRAAISVGKLYVPSVAIGALSIGLLAGSHTLLNRRNAAVTAAYATLDRGFREYRQRVIADVGAEKDQEFRYGFETLEITEDSENGKKKTRKVKHVGRPNGASIYARYFDEYSVNWKSNPEYNRFFLQCQQNYMNDLLNARGHVFLNEVYDSLGLERTSAGAVVGWVLSKGGDNFVDFGIFDETRLAARDFINGREPSVLLDFNVDGVIYDKI